MSCHSTQDSRSPLDKILESAPIEVSQILDNPARYQVQIRYTKIDRDSKGIPHLTSYDYRVDTAQYFYPASTVKMPVAILALERINELSKTNPKINMHSRLQYGAGMAPQTEMVVDSSSPSGYPQVAHFIEQIFSISDNEAYVRLYELLGSDYINKRLQEIGAFSNSRIRARVGISGYDTEANRYTNPVTILSDGGDTLYTQREQYALHQDFSTLMGTHVGSGYYDDDLDSVIYEPFDMSEKNFISVPELEGVLRRVIMPETYADSQRYLISDEQREFLLSAMSQLPHQYDYHRDHDEYTDGYVKFFVYGDTKDTIPDHIKIYNKVGWAYGTLTDCAYIVDTDSEVEFFLTATILVNDNNIYNDGIYEYEEVGIPFLASLGRTVLEYERRRQH